MELDLLRLVVTEVDLNRELASHQPADMSLENLAARILPEGIRISGSYSLMVMSLSFETLWTLTGKADTIEARLSDLQVAGFPASKLRSLLLKVLYDSIPPKPGVNVDNDMLRVNLTELLASEKVPLRVNLAGIDCYQGRLVVRVGC
jgi:hypothetical protein